jgi:hypothetical protein
MPIRKRWVDLPSGARVLAYTLNPDAPMTDPVGWEAECAAFIRDGLRIAAIKRHRELHGSSLREAFDAIAGLAEQIGYGRLTSPQSSL